MMNLQTLLFKEAKDTGPSGIPSHLCARETGPSRDKVRKLILLSHSVRLVNASIGWCSCEISPASLRLESEVQQARTSPQKLWSQPLEVERVLQYPWVGIELDIGPEEWVRKSCDTPFPAHCG